jgi:hypothetical protein
LAEAADVVNRATATLYADHEGCDGISHAAGDVLATLFEAKDGCRAG